MSAEIWPEQLKIILETAKLNPADIHVDMEKPHVADLLAKARARLPDESFSAYQERQAAILRFCEANTFLTANLLRRICEASNDPNWRFVFSTLVDEREALHHMQRGRE
ncbi:MAG TPA: hypothetical protein VFQ60_05180 [Patescibacteria group bacterium]|nr:hypothetical protein [Patescibacteria group bacterium]